jgi:hypothetical protein
VYEYDYYQPYDARPADDAAQASEEMTAADDVDEYPAREAYAYDHQLPRDADEGAGKAATLPAQDESDAELEHQDFGRYPYGCGCGEAYDYMYRADSAAAESCPGSQQQEPRDAAVELIPMAQRGRQLVTALKESEWAAATRGGVRDLLHRWEAVVDRVDMDRIRAELSHNAAIRTIGTGSPRRERIPLLV